MGSVQAACVLSAPEMMKCFLHAASSIQAWTGAKPQKARPSRAHEASHYDLFTVYLQAEQVL